MATKKEIHESALKICKDNGLNEKVTGLFTELLAPKSAGNTVDLATVTKVENGKVTQIQCQLSKVWLPATVAFFYEEKAEGKGIVGTDGKALRRLSRQAESISKQHIKTTNTSVNAITSDVLDGKLDAAKGKTMVAAIKAKKPDYSKVTANPVKVEPKAPETKPAS